MEKIPVTQEILDYCTDIVSSNLEYDNLGVVDTIITNHEDECFIILLKNGKSYEIKITLEEK